METLLGKSKRRERAVLGVQELYGTSIREAAKGTTRCNAELVNEHTGERRFIPGLIPIMATSSKIKGLVFAVMESKPGQIPDNYSIGTRCFINGIEHPILTDEMINKGEF